MDPNRPAAVQKPTSTPQVQMLSRFLKDQLCRYIDCLTSAKARYLECDMSILSIGANTDMTPSFALARIMYAHLTTTEIIRIPASIC